MLVVKIDLRQIWDNLVDMVLVFPLPATLGLLISLHDVSKEFIAHATDAPSGLVSHSL